MLLYRSCFYTGHASIQVMLLYRSCFYTGHASIQVMLLYRSCFYSSHASIQVMLLFKSCFYTGHASIQVMLLYRSCFYSSHASIQVMLLYRSCFYSSHASIQVMLSYATLQSTVSNLKRPPLHTVGGIHIRPKQKIPVGLFRVGNPSKRRLGRPERNFFWDPFLGSFFWFINRCVIGGQQHQHMCIIHCIMARINVTVD